MVLSLPPLRRVRWKQAWRIIAARHPPIHLFERATPDPESWDLLMAAEMLVNPRVQDEVGGIALVPPEDRVSGPGASWVMAAFTHVNPAGSRFSDGSYGVYYAGRALETAIAETVFHFERFARDAADPPRYESFRALLSAIDAVLHDLGDDRAALDPDSYAAGQGLGRRWVIQMPPRPQQASSGLVLNDQLDRAQRLRPELAIGDQAEVLWID